MMGIGILLMRLSDKKNEGFFVSRSAPDIAERDHRWEIESRNSRTEDFVMLFVFTGIVLLTLTYTLGV